MALKSYLSMAGATLALLTPNLHAQELQQPTLEVHGAIGHNVFESPYDDERHYELGLGWNFSEHWSLEVVGTDFNTTQQFQGPRLDGHRVHVSALYHLLGPEHDSRPFISLGAGTQRVSTDGAPYFSDRYSQLNAGVGFKQRLTKHLQWRTDLRMLADPMESNTDFAISTGLSLLFGFNETRAAAPPPEPQQPLDSDNDGVINERDNCPNTPQGARVDSQGCERDSDRDGVVDSQDQCPGTARQYKVDSTGCPIELSENVSIEMRVEFATNSAEVREAYMSEIKKVADFMNQFDKTRVTVEGHTDNTGAAAYNQDLSQRRAESVRQVLINRFGLSADRVNAVGYGEERPTASNDTAEGRELNRRVVAEISTDVTRTQTRD